MFGVALIAVSGWISQTDVSKATEVGIVILWYGVGFGIFMFLIGLAGWFAVRKESRCLLLIVYWIHNVF